MLSSSAAGSSTSRTPPSKPVPLNKFDPGGTAEAVRHGRTHWIGGRLPPADPPHKVIARAEFLLANFPDLRYNLIGNNGEHIANCCTSGGWTESHQIRRYFGIRVLISAGIMWFLAARSRSNRPLTNRANLAIGLYVLAGFASIMTYNHHIRRFWQQSATSGKLESPRKAPRPRRAAA